MNSNRPNISLFGRNNTDACPDTGLPDVETCTTTTSTFAAFSQRVNCSEGKEQLSKAMTNDCDTKCSADDLSYINTPLYRAYTPLLRSLTMLGLLHRRHVAKNGDSWWRARPNASQVTSSIRILLFLANLKCANA